MKLFRRFLRILAWAAGVLLALFVIMLFNVYRHGSKAYIQSTDAIVVLGAAQWNGKPSPIFQKRLDYAFDLYGQGYAPYIIVTGGIGEGASVAEAAVGKEYLIEKGVESEHIITEEKSRTTIQNIRNASGILKDYSWQSVLLVSHDFHLMRAQKMARDAGIVSYAAPVKTDDTVVKFRYSVREVVMNMLYELFGV